MLQETHCDGVMIGRGVLGNPWLIKECVEYLENGIEPKPVSNEEKIKMMRYHYQSLKEDKNQKIAFLEIRSHLLYYLKNMPNHKEIKKKICMTKTEEELLKIIDDYEIYLKELI